MKLSFETTVIYLLLAIMRRLCRTHTIDRNDLTEFELSAVEYGEEFIKSKSQVL